MNKKLIDKYGFKQSELDGYCCFKVINGNLIEYNEDLQELYIFNNDIGAGDPASVTTQTSIRGVVALVLDCTGVDLTKKTKCEEIEELKVRFGEMEDAMKSQNDVIEGLKGRINPTKRKCFFGLDYGLDAVDALAYSVNQMIRKDVNKLIEQGDERILSKLKPIDTSKLKQAMKSMQDMCDKRTSEMPAEEKKGFEAGDSVVKKGNGDYFRDGDELIIKGKKTDHNCYWCQSKSMPTIEKYVHERNLEHAPAERPKEKALEFGDPLECMVSKFHLKTGQKVIFLRVETPVPNNVRYIVSTESGLTYALRTNEVKLL